jgi:formylglycine-generating enzyme required for sulfatase activity
MEVSSDGGTTYIPISKGCTGDIGPNIFAGSWSITWDLVGADWYEPWDDVSFPESRIKIIALGYEVLENLPLEMVNVPAGDYTSGQNDEIRNIAYDYQVSKYEITNAQYAEFLINAFAEGSVWLPGGVEGYYSGDEIIGPGNQIFYSLDGDSTNTGYDNYGQIYWNGTTFVVPEGYGDHPVIKVTWYGALAFARYYGLRLPDEYEWEKAARGNTGYDYPLGNSINGSQANYYDSGDPWDNGTTPAGFFNGQTFGGFQTTDSPSPYGAYDMAGNVAEWTHSWYIQYTTNSRMVRGGGWVSDTSWITSWILNGSQPDNNDIVIGFRVARTTSQAE